MTAAAELGSERVRAQLEARVNLIDDMDGPEWTEDDPQGHKLSSALREVRRRQPLLSLALIDKIVASTRYNVARNGVAALQAMGDGDALARLLALHETSADWLLRDTIANAIELVASRQGIMILKVDGGYRFAS